MQILAVPKECLRIDKLKRIGNMFFKCTICGYYVGSSCRLQHEYNHRVSGLFNNPNNRLIGDLRDLYPENAKKAELIKKLSIDTSFGILTRQAFELIEFDKIKDKITGIIFGDIDGMHELNEKFGYQEVDRRIREALKISGKFVAARWYSGDEIVWVLLEGDAYRVSDWIKTHFKNEELGITVSARTLDNPSLMDWRWFMAIIKSLTENVRVAKLENQRV